MSGAEKTADNRPGPSPKAKRAGLLGVLLLVLAGLVVAKLMLRKFEYANVYHPSRQADSAITDLSNDGEDLFLVSADDTKLHAWFIPAKGDSENSDCVVLYCHGNGGNLTSRGPHYRLLLELGVNIMAFDYRGYGQSEGEVDEDGTYHDAFAAYDWVIERGFTGQQIIAWGESLGGGVASRVALDRKVGALILNCSFTSTPDVGAEWFPFLPVRYLASIHYDTHSRLPEIKCPVVVMHAKDDNIIPFHHSEKNFAAANEPKIFVEQEGGHNDGVFAAPEKFKEGLRAALKLMSDQKAK